MKADLHDYRGQQVPQAVILQIRELGKPVDKMPKNKAS